MRTWQSDSELSKPSRLSIMVAASLVTAAVVAAGCAARPAGETLAQRTHSTCLSAVERYDYAPELCDGKTTEQAWIAQGFQMYGTAQYNGNALDAIVTASMAAQGLDIDGDSLTAVTLVKPSS